MLPNDDWNSPHEFQLQVFRNEDTDCCSLPFVEWTTKWTTTDGSEWRGTKHATT